MTGQNSEYGIYTQDRQLLSEMLQGLAMDENVIYAAILNQSQEVILEKKFTDDFSPPHPAPETIESLQESESPKGRYSIQFCDQSHIHLEATVVSRVDRVWTDDLNLAPSNADGKQIGYIRLILSLDKFNQEINGFIYSIALFAVILIVISVAFTMVLTRKIARPIALLAHISGRIAEGDFDQNIEIQGSGELSSLIRAFSLMIERLRSYRQRVEQYQGDLEQKIRARTGQLEKLLGQAQELTQRAEAANRSKSEFLANMSHELRTPLNHIIGFTELLSAKTVGDLNPDQEEYLNDVLTSSRHLLSLINDILDLSKVEAGKMQLELSEVNIRELVSGSLTMVKEKALKQRIRLNTHVEDGLESIQCDGRKVKQVLYNLLSNAVKFTPPGGAVEIGASLWRGNQAGGVGGNGGPPKQIDWAPEEGRMYLQIWVSDTGIGIRQEDLERIFQPFEQADGSHSRQYQGTGLGLSLTRRLAELHGGVVWAQSQGPGRGSRFNALITDYSHQTLSH
jgi:signal transduction histidine kinase